MTRLIDADEIRWADHYDSDGNLSKYKVAYSDEMPPAVDAVPVRHGKWIKADSQQYFRKHYPCFTCSECGYRKDSQKKWNYCPQCGANMRGEEEWTK